MDTVERLEWKLISENRETGTIEVKTEMSLRSWGEEVLIQVAKEKEGNIITVASGVSSQIFDWGKNKENEEKFHKEMSRVILR